MNEGFETPGVSAKRKFSLQNIVMLDATKSIHSFSSQHHKSNVKLSSA